MYYIYIRTYHIYIPLNINNKKDTLLKKLG